MWVFAWFYVSSVVSPARRDIFVTSQGTDSYYLAGSLSIDISIIIIIISSSGSTTTTTTTTTTIIIIIISIITCYYYDYYY